MLIKTGLLWLTLVSAVSASPRFHTPISWTDGTNAALHAKKDLTVGLTVNGTCSVQLDVPHCRQACGMWCWATVTEILKEMYGGALQQKALSAQALNCTSGECQIVSDTFGEACCQLGCGGGCNQGVTPSTIQDVFTKHVGRKLTYQDGYPSQSELEAELAAGRPIVRLTSGHIDIVSGCSEGQFRLTDSEYDDVVLVPYSDLVQSPYNAACKWVGTYWVSP